MPTPFSLAVLLDKDQGVSSFSALGSLKKRFATRRVGHTGTLDPMATGLLLALVGPATRCARFFSGLDKTYEAEVTFGTETDTDDSTGTVTVRSDLPDIEHAAGVARGFAGTITQSPPAYSAIHVEGKRAYELARAGTKVELPQRQVTIHTIAANITDTGTLRLVVSCSSGTYIRSLARDIGRAADSAAHLSYLRRTHIGPFSTDEVDKASGRELLELEIADALARIPGFSLLDVDAADARRMRNGQEVNSRESDASGLVLARFRDRPVAVGRWVDNRFHYEVVFPVTENRDD